MSCGHCDRQPVARRVEFAVICLLCVIAAGLVGCGVSASKQGAQRLECTHNLREIGSAMHHYYDTTHAFLTEGPKDYPSFYKELKVFLEPNVKDNGPVKVYLCPSRRTIEQAPGKRDFGYAASSPDRPSVLDAPEPLILSAIAEKGNGLEYVVVLSHLWMAPATYTGGDPTDLGWATKNNSRAVNTVAKADSDPSGSIVNIGGPHPNVVPSMFADGSVRNIPYDFMQWPDLWAYNSRNRIKFP
jgi:hypothetical protein